VNRTRGHSEALHLACRHAILLTMFVRSNMSRKEKRREETRREILDAAWEAAREHGLAALTLREVAARVGMQAPSLYSYFPSKDAIYDAMFAEAWSDCLESMTAHMQTVPDSPRNALKAVARHFFDFAVADLPRHQLMNQRALPHFHPSPEAYAPSVALYEGLKALLRQLGIQDPDAADLYTALVGGLVEQQLANNPGGDRWARLLDRTIDMYADEMNV
jgi:AcrR family transcriptional regulator